MKKKESMACWYNWTDTHSHKNCNPHHETFYWIYYLPKKKIPISFVPSLLHCLFFSITYSCSLAVIIIYKSSFTSSIITHNILVCCCLSLYVHFVQLYSLTHSLTHVPWVFVHLYEWMMVSRDISNI